MKSENHLELGRWRMYGASRLALNELVSLFTVFPLSRYSPSATYFVGEHESVAMIAASGIKALCSAIFDIVVMINVG